MTKKNARLALAGAALLIAAAAWWWLFGPGAGGGNSSFVSRYEERFAPAMADFIELRPAPGEERGPDPEPEVAYRPKVAVIDVGGRKLDPVHDRLPDSLRAESPDEVGTVVLIDCKSTRSNEAGALNATFRTHCTAFFIDWKKRRHLATRYASRSPTGKDGMPLPFVDVVAERPTEALLKHVLVKFDMR